MNYMSPIVYAPVATTATTPGLRRGGSATLRKRSMPGGDPSRLSFAARKSESDKDLLGAMAPLGVVFMEQIALDIDVLREPHAEIKYVMKVRHLKTNASWTHARGFDEYRRFQHKLLKTLDHGHFCSAECPWLYTFLKSYFPKKHLFHFATARVVASRKEALQRFFISLQGFLLNRANHNCSIVSSAVVDAVVEFVYGEYAKYYQLEEGADNQRGGSFTYKGPLRGPEACPEDEECSTTSPSSSCTAQTASSMCTLCESSLDGEAHAASRSYASNLTSSGFTSTASSTSLMSDESLLDTSDILGTMSSSAPAATSALSRRATHYLMTLGCGHQFHDECIVPKLNETLRCPTCDHLEVK